MEVTVTDKGGIKLQKVYNEILLESADGETMTICMRDSGFELIYDGRKFEAKKGEIFELKTIALPKVK